MISLQSRMANPPFSVCEYNATKDGRFAWFLLTWHPEKDIILEEIVAEIKLEIINSGLGNISRLEIQKWLVNFANDLHWKVHARFRKSNLMEKGLSVFLGVLYDHELFFIQAGRIFCVISDLRSFRPVGKDWKNYQIQSQEGMQLLGYADNDIKLKTHRVRIGENQQFITISGDLARKVFPKVEDPATIDALIETYTSEVNPLWLILEGKDKLLKPARRKLSRLQVTSIILITLAVLATVYIQFGNRMLDQVVHKLRLSYQREKTMRLEQIPSILEINNTNLRDYMDRIVNLPARNISMEIAWSTDLPYEVSMSPVFSLDNIYLVSEDRLNAYDKKNRQLLWSKVFPSNITSVLLGQNNILVNAANQQVFGLKEDGSLLWQHDLPTQSLISDRFSFYEIHSSDDPRLNRSIVVVPSKRGISILDPSRGEMLSSLTLKQDLEALSGYDNFANCFYAVVDGAILCIDLKIEN